MGRQARLAAGAVFVPGAVAGAGMRSGASRDAFPSGAWERHRGGGALLPFVLRVVAGACVGRGSGQPRMPPRERQHEGLGGGLGDSFTRSGEMARGGLVFVFSWRLLRCRRGILSHPQARTGAGFSAILTRGIFRAIIGQLRRGGRVVDGARLESAYAATHRGFESHSLRQLYIPRIACVPSLT